MEIEINEFIRTKKGLLAKVCAYQDLTTFDDKKNWVTFHSFDTDKGSIADVEIAKHNEDLLELIECGDVLKVREISTGEIIYIGLDKETTTLNYNEIIESIRIKEFELLQILTKEQFKSEAYQVKKEDKEDE